MKSVENKNFKISVNRCIFASCTKIYEIKDWTIIYLYKLYIFTNYIVIDEK